MNNGLITSRRRGQAALIGLVAALAIMAILAALIYPNIAGRAPVNSKGERTGPATPLDRADDTACIAYMDQITQAATMYRQDHNRPPRDLESLKPYGVTQDIIEAPCQYPLPAKAQDLPATGQQNSSTPPYPNQTTSPQAQQPPNTTGVAGQPGLHVPTSVGTQTDPTTGDGN